MGEVMTGDSRESTPFAPRVWRSSDDEGDDSVRRFYAELQELFVERRRLEKATREAEGAVRSAQSAIQDLRRAERECEAQQSNVEGLLRGIEPKPASEVLAARLENATR